MGVRCNDWCGPLVNHPWLGATDGCRIALPAVLGDCVLVIGQPWSWAMTFETYSADSSWEANRTASARPSGGLLMPGEPR